MKKCTIYYYSLTDEMRKEEKWEWFTENKIKNISFEHIQPDKNNNWLDLTDNDWDTMIPTISYEVKTSNVENTLFKIFSNGISTNRDYWVYDDDPINLERKINYFIDKYKEFSTLLKNGKFDNNFDVEIKWSHAFKNKFLNLKEINFDKNKITSIYYRPFKRIYYYCDFDLSDLITSTHFEISGENLKQVNKMIWFKCGITSYFFTLCIDKVHDIMPNGGSKCLPLYRYDTNGNKIDNITDWGLEQFHNNYDDKTISKEDIFDYVYAVLHNPEYRKKYEMNLKREFPRIPFYEDFWKWAGWGKQLMDLHINFETVEEYPLRVSGAVDSSQEEINSETLNPKPYTQIYKAKLKANKENGTIELDNQTTLSGIPKEVWDYKLGNRSALEWILDQYKEKKPKDPTIADKFNTYRFIDYKDKVIDLIKRVTTVSVETVKIVGEMRNIS